MQLASGLKRLETIGDGMDVVFATQKVGDVVTHVGIVVGNDDELVVEGRHDSVFCERGKLLRRGVRGSAGVARQPTLRFIDISFRRERGRCQRPRCLYAVSRQMRLSARNRDRECAATA